MNILRNNSKIGTMGLSLGRAGLPMVLCLPGALCAVQGSPLAMGLESPEVPTLVTIGPGAAMDIHTIRTRALLASDTLLDFGVASREVPEDRPAGQSQGAWLRQRHGLPSATQARRVWVLLGRGGRALASGRVLPEPEGLAPVLEAAGERNSVALLQAFLREHQDHSEARLDLVQALLPRLQARLCEHPIADGQDLAPDIDARVWGPIARELDLLFQNRAVMSLNLNLDLLPEGVRERSSPLMKALYRRHEPSLVVDLQRFPENPRAWFNLLRMDQALGEQELLLALAGINWFRVRPIEAAMIPYGLLAQRIHQEACRKGEWRLAVATERTLWDQLAQPKLAYYGKAYLLPPGADADERELWNWAERDTVWTQLLAPLLEAMVRAGVEWEVPEFLGRLDEGWAGVGLDVRLRGLARAVGRLDLARIWIAAIQTPPGQIPREGLLGHDRVVFHLGQQLIPDQAVQAYDQPFRKKGMTVGIQPVPSSWAKRLGWSGSAPRWALVDAQGQVLLQGERLPSGEELLAAYQARSLPMDLERVTTFRQEHPEHLGALAIEARIRGTIAWAYSVDRNPGSTAGLPMGGAEREAWVNYLAVLECLLGEPLGSCPGLMRTAQVHFPAPKELGEAGQDLGLEGLSRRLLPKLETRLSQQPSDMDLWWLWLVFAPHLERPLTALLDSLAPSPVAPPADWPPQEILVAAAQGLIRQERWQDLVDLLQPRWSARRVGVEMMLRAKDPAAAHGYCQNWSWELSRPLLEGLLRLGRSREADQILEALAQGGGHPNTFDLGSLCQVARELGVDSWVTKWSHQIPSAP